MKLYFRTAPVSVLTLKFSAALAAIMIPNRKEQADTAVGQEFHPASLGLANAHTLRLHVVSGEDFT